jgi:uncharacterized protein YjdB
LPATLSLAEDSMKHPAVRQPFMRRALTLLPMAAAVIFTTWACDPGQGVGVATTTNRAAAIDVDGTAFSVIAGNGDVSPGFDVINPALADPFKDSKGRLVGVHVQWTSSNPAVISVVTPDVVSSSIQAQGDKFGAKVTLHPAATGTATITGVVSGAPTVNDAPVTVSITVSVVPFPTKVVASPNPVTVLTTDTALVTAQPFAADGTAVAGNSEWVCGDTTIAMVGAVGDSNQALCGRLADPTNPGSSRYLIVDYRVIVYPKKPGTTFVAVNYHVTLAGVSKVFTDTVRIIVATGVSKVVVTPATANLVVGGTRQLAAQAFDLAGHALTGLPITWGSRNASVISVDANGTAKGLASGTGPGLTQSANAFATIAGVTADATLTVYRTPGNVIVTPTPANIGIGQSLTLHARLVDSDNTTPIPFSATAVSWKSDNATLASVTQVNDSTATVTGVALGVTAARATVASGASGVSDVTVRAASVASSLVLQVVTGTTTRVAVRTGEPMSMGGTLPLTSEVRDQNGVILTDAVGYSSSNAAVATVDPVSGLVTAKAVGNATITAKSSLNPSLTSAVVVVVSAPGGGSPVSMKLTPSTATVKVGTTQQYTATLYDANGSVTAMPAGGTIGFNVDDSNIASVVYTSGLLSASGAGTTFVRASLAINGVETNIFAAATLTVVP